MHEGARTIDAPSHRSGAPSDSTGGRGRGGGRGGRRRKGGRRRRRGKGRILAWAALGLSVLLVGTAGAAWLYIEHLNDNLRKGERNSSDGGATRGRPNAAGQTPLNVLLLGSDSRNSKGNVSLGGGRGEVGRKPLADVQMLLHVSADRSNASLVSIPRDTRVGIPKCTDPKTGEVFPPVNAIINESLARGGPGCTLATWEKLTDIYIDHWMMIDFAGVVSMADAVGGVEVCVKQNIWDRDLKTGRGGSGLKLEAGKQKVQGRKALQWLRTRYAFGSDVNRTHAQHMYINSMVRELRSQNVFTDTGRLMGLAEAATKALAVDGGLGSVKKLFDLGMELKSVPSDRITTSTMPSVEDPRNPTAHLIPKPVEAERLFTMMREDVPFDEHGRNKPKKSAAAGDEGPEAAAKDTIPVTVLNGTGADGRTPVQGRAGAVAGMLAASGFTRAAAGTEPRPQASTTLTYPESLGPQGKADALSVAEALHLPKSAVEQSADATAVTLVVGADWTEGAAYSAGAPEEGAVPDSANALNGGDKSACMDVYEPFVW